MAVSSIQTTAVWSAAASTKTTSLTPTAGNLLVLMAVSQSTTAMTVSDNVDGAWTADSGGAHAGAGSMAAFRMEFFYLKNTSGSAKTITVSGSSVRGMSVWELSGADASAPFVTSSFGTQLASSSATSPSLTFAVGDMALAATIISQNTTTRDADWTLDQHTNFGDNESDHKAITSAGADSITWGGTSGDWVFGIARIAVASSGTNVSVTGLGSAASFGSVTAAPGTVTTSVTGLASAAAFGTATPAPGGVTASITGLASAASFGAPTAAPGAVSAALSGLASAQSFGTPSATSGSIIASVSGLASAASFGALTLAKGGVDVSVDGVASAAQFGTPIGNQRRSVSGVDTAQSFGSVSTSTGPAVVPIIGIDSAQSFGGVGTSGGEPPTFSPAIHGGRHHHR